MEKKKEKKLLLPMLVAVVCAIIIYFLSLLFVEDFNNIKNYVFLAIIYVFLYGSLYMLFNDIYVNFMKKYINTLKKIFKIVKIASSIDKWIDIIDISITERNLILNYDQEKLNSFKKETKPLKILFLLIILGFLLVILFVWQLVVGVNFDNIFCLGSIFVAILLLFTSPSLMQSFIEHKKINEIVEKNKQSK